LWEIVAVLKSARKLNYVAQKKSFVEGYYSWR